MTLKDAFSWDNSFISHSRSIIDIYIIEAFGLKKLLPSILAGNNFWGCCSLRIAVLYESWLELYIVGSIKVVSFSAIRGYLVRNSSNNISTDNQFHMSRCSKYILVAKSPCLQQSEEKALPIRTSTSHVIFYFPQNPSWQNLPQL